jgi:acetyl esterase/lipase
MELDEAYANAAHIPGGETYPERWAQAAAKFRETTLCELDLPYGESARQKLDLFHPPRLAKGLVVFVHGGYWLMSDKSDWSHLAAGPLAQGWAVAMPSYDLCPAVRITDIGNQIAAAISYAAARVPGPIRLIGHSAGGQLVARMTARRNGARWQDRIAKVVPISPLGDLAPLMRTSMNADLKLDNAEVLTESPIHLPKPQIPVSVWVGAHERSAFLEQSRALADAWKCERIVAPECHHFDVFEPLCDAESALTAALLAG